MLGDMGADVIKVEPPEGDTTRRLGPARHPGMAAFFLACNRNKRSIVLDLKHDAGRKVLLRLAETADVMMHNFRPQPAARLGLEYEVFRAVNPGLVYCATYGFRAAGPYGHKPAYDDVIQAASGLASLQTPLTGDPRYMPTIVADKTSSLTVLSAVLSALYHRARTGRGPGHRGADVRVGGGLRDGRAPLRRDVRAGDRERRLQAHPEPLAPAVSRPRTAISPSCRTPTRTGRRSSKSPAGPDFAADPRFKSLESRLANIEVLYEELGKIVSTRTSAEWLEALERANVPATVVNTLESLLEDPHLAATGFWKIVEHPTEGTLRTPDIPTTYSKTPGEIRRLPAAARRAQRRGAARGRATARAEIDAMLASRATIAS